MVEVLQLIASATEESILLVYLAMYSDICLECVLIDAGLCASIFEVEVPFPSKVVPDYYSLIKLHCR